MDDGAPIFVRNFNFRDSDFRLDSRELRDTSVCIFVCSLDFSVMVRMTSVQSFMPRWQWSFRSKTAARLKWRLRKTRLYIADRNGSEKTGFYVSFNRSHDSIHYIGWAKHFLYILSSDHLSSYLFFVKLARMSTLWMFERVAVCMYEVALF